MSLLARLRGLFLDDVSDEDVEEKDEQEMTLLERRQRGRSRDDLPLEREKHLHPSPDHPGSVHGSGWSHRRGSGTQAEDDDIRLVASSEETSRDSGDGKLGTEESTASLSTSGRRDDSNLTGSTVLDSVSGHHRTQTILAQEVAGADQDSGCITELEAIPNIDTYAVLSLEGGGDTEVTYTYQCPEGDDGGEGMAESGTASSETGDFDGGWDVPQLRSVLKRSSSERKAIHTSDTEWEQYCNHTKASFDLKALSDLPVRMKNAQGVYYNGELHVGGGYTERAKTATVVYVYHKIFNLWSPLAVNCPLKWFGMVVFEGALVAIGGKEAQKTKSDGSNRLASWDPEGGQWSFSLPPMSAARASPTCFTHGSYLVVAGGKKGILDYQVELLSGEERQWIMAEPLPFPCSAHLSWASEGNWYLLNEGNTCTDVYCTDVQGMIDRAREQRESLIDARRHADEATSELSPLAGEFPPVSSPGLRQSSFIHQWHRLPSHTVTATPIRVASLGRLLVTICRPPPHAPSVFLSVCSFHSATGQWCEVGHLLPTCTNATLSCSPDGSLVAFGGDTSDCQYSNKAYQLMLEEGSIVATGKTSRVKGSKLSVTFRT